MTQLGAIKVPEKNSDEPQGTIKESQRVAKSHKEKKLIAFTSKNWFYAISLKRESTVYCILKESSCNYSCLVMYNTHYSPPQMCRFGLLL